MLILFKSYTNMFIYLINILVYMQSVAQTVTVSDPPDGVHHPNDVEYIARLAVREGGDRLSQIVFNEELRFSIVTAFVNTRDGRSYYQTRPSACNRREWRGGRAGMGQMCKHQKALCEALRKREPPSLPHSVIPLSEVVA